MLIAIEKQKKAEEKEVMKKYFLGVIIVIVMVVLAACGKEAETVVAEDNSNIENEVAVEDQIDENEEATLAVSEEKSIIYLEGSCEEREEENSFSRHNKIFAFYEPEDYYAKSASSSGGSGDVVAVMFRVGMEEQKIGFSYDYNEKVKKFLKNFLATGICEIPEEGLIFNEGFDRNEVSIMSLELKDAIETIYGKVRVVYATGQNSVSGEARAYEWAIINVNQHDVLINWEYGEKSDYQGVLSAELPALINVPEMEEELKGQMIIPYGEYECLVQELSTNIFGYNTPEGFIQENGHMSGEDGWMEIYSLHSLSSVSSYMEDVVNFINTGEYIEGSENEYGHKLISMEGDNVETSFGTVNIVYKSYYNPNMLREEAVEYGVLCINENYVFINYNYNDMSEYKGIIKKLLPEMTAAKTD